MYVIYKEIEGDHSPYYSLHYTWRDVRLPPYHRIPCWGSEEWNSTVHNETQSGLASGVMVEILSSILESNLYRTLLDKEEAETRVARNSSPGRSRSRYWRVILVTAPWLLAMIRMTSVNIFVCLLLQMEAFHFAVCFHNLQAKGTIYPILIIFGISRRVRSCTSGNSICHSQAVRPARIFTDVVALTTPARKILEKWKLLLY